MRIEAGTDVERSLLGPLLEGRGCGECTICCTTLKVDTPDFRKPAGTPCAHVGAGGCAIHAVRPHICRTWYCGWRRVAALPEAARPDRSGLLVSVSFVREPRNCLEGVSINVRLLAGSTAIEDGTAAAVLDALCARLIPVWFSDGSSKMLMHPANDVAQHVIAGTEPPARLAAEVNAWRARYAMFVPAEGRGSA